MPIASTTMPKVITTTDESTQGDHPASIVPQTQTSAPYTPYPHPTKLSSLLSSPPPTKSRELP
jgi:hypothetical protein